MKSTVKRAITALSSLALGPALLIGVAAAQQPGSNSEGAVARKTNSTKTVAVRKSETPPKKKAPVVAPENGEKAGDFNVIGSIEFGYRGISIDGDRNKYKSDLNYTAGPRLFDSSFLMRKREGTKGGLFDDLLVTSTGWGGDPSGQMRISAENSKWFRFDGSYRRFKYFRFLNNFVNPNFATQPPSLVTGEHGYDTRQQMGDFDLTILPKNERIKFIVGYSPERYSGLAYTTYHLGGDDFVLPGQLRTRANDFRVGADGKLGPIDFSFLQGFRRFRDDSFIDNQFVNLGANPAASNASFTSLKRNDTARGSVNYTRFSLHSLVARKLDLTARVIYSSATSNYVFAESFTGPNFNTRITGALGPPNILTLGQYYIPGNAKKPNTLADFGASYSPNNHLRISNTFRVETFQINGGDFFSDAFYLTRTTGVAVAPIIVNGPSVYKTTKYRKYQDTVEGDYQINNRYSFHLGYRYGTRHEEQFISGFGLNTNSPVAIPTELEIEDNHTHAVFGGFKFRPVKSWTLFFDAERGTADNVFTRIGNYDHTNIRAKTRWAPTQKLSLNLALISRDNSNPSEIAGVSLEDFGVTTKSRVFSSSVDWTVRPGLAISTGYNYNWANSNAVVDYYYNAVRHPFGHSLYYVRNNFFFFDTTARLNRRATLYASYRINKDNGQGNRLADPTGTPGYLVTSYPMSFQGPEARVAFKINRRLDWNVGYQYFNYNESRIVGPRPQNYHAHLPYMSLRFYFGRGE